MVLRTNPRFRSQQSRPRGVRNVAREGRGLPKVTKSYPPPNSCQFQNNDIHCRYINQGQVLMHIKIQRWGNSAAVRLPVNVLKDLDLGSGDVLDLNVERGALLMKPVKEKLRFDLADLVAQCNLQAPRDSELEAWDRMTQVGNEAW